MKIALTGHQNSRMRGREEKVMDWLIVVMALLTVYHKRITLIYGSAPTGADELWAQFYLESCNQELVDFWIYEGYEGQCKNKTARKAASRIWYATKKGEMLDNYNFVKDSQMVDDCDILLAVWDGVEEGGTWETIKYAESVGKPIIYMPPSYLLTREVD